MKFTVKSMALVAALMAASATAQTKWDLASAYAPANFHTENLVQFATEVDKATAGKLKITVHSNASLFKAPEIKRSVQGMMLLFTVPWPPQGVYSKKPLTKGDDLKGSKWRAYSPATAKLAELLGAQPVTVQAAELSQALSTGVVESYMSSGSTGYDTKTYESIKNWYDTQAWLPKNAVIVNKKAFDALDKPTQTALLKVAKDAEVRGWKISEEKNNWYKDQLKAKGMNIAVPSEQLVADLRKAGNVMLAEWQRKAGDEGRAIVADYRTK